MQRTQSPIIGSIIVGLLVLAGALVVVRVSRSDVDLCREVLVGLTEGRPAVRHRIDWERFNALDVNVGATYSQLANDVERSRYRQAFLENFAKGFHHVGGDVRGFVNWRVQERRPDQIVIAADYTPKHTMLLMAVGRSWPKKIGEIRWATCGEGGGPCQ